MTIEPQLNVTGFGCYGTLIDWATGIRAYLNGVLSSGHIAPSDTMLLFRRAKEPDIRRLVVTYPHANFVGIRVDPMIEIGELGALNKIHYAMTLSAVHYTAQKLSHIADLIGQVGVERCVVAADADQAANPPLPEMFHTFIIGWLQLGCSSTSPKVSSAT